MRCLIIFLFIIFSSNIASAESVVGKKLLCKRDKNIIFKEIGLYFVNPKSLIEYFEPFYSDTMSIENYKTRQRKFNYKVGLNYIYIRDETDHAKVGPVFELNRSTLDYDRIGRFKCKLVDQEFDFNSYFQEKIDLYIKNKKLKRKI